MNDRSEGSLIEMDHLHRQKQKTPLRCQVTIDKLHDDVLLEIFDHYLAEADQANKLEEWQTLVHVCQQWRYVVFQSPLRLNLRILCSAGKPVREKLDLWPPLPIFIKQWRFSASKCSEDNKDNIIAALEHDDRVFTIDLTLPSSLLESVFPAMLKTFVALKDLGLCATGGEAPVVSDSFLGGSAPHLRRLRLSCIQFSFPVLRRLLLSSPNLVTLSLDLIPHSGYFTPEAIVTCLSALTRLDRLSIEFESPLSRPPQGGRHTPPTRSVLPALTEFKFDGVIEYLEDLVTRIDTPLLGHLGISFHPGHRLIFDTPQLVQFITRTPKLKTYDEADVIFSYSRAVIALWKRYDLRLELGILSRRSDRQLFFLADVCISSFPRALISTVKDLYILEDDFMGPLLWRDDLENDRWLDFFHPFTTVKNLYLSHEFVPRIVPTLQEIVGERVTDVLPNLESIFLEEPDDPEEPGLVPEAMRQFIAAQQLSGRPIAIFQGKIPWERLGQDSDSDSISI